MGLVFFVTFISLCQDGSSGIYGDVLGVREPANQCDDRGTPNTLSAAQQLSAVAAAVSAVCSPRGFRTSRVEDYPGRSYDVLRCGLASELLFQVEFRPTIVGSRVFAYPVLLKVMREHAQTQRTDEKRSERDEQIRPIDGSEFCRGFSYSLSFLTPRDRHAGSKRRRTSFNAFPWLHRSVAGFSSMAASEERQGVGQKTGVFLTRNRCFEFSTPGFRDSWRVCRSTTKERVATSV